MHSLRHLSIPLSLMVLTACASAPPPPPPPKPAPAAVTVAPPVVAAPKQKPAPPRPKAAPPRPSMATADEIRFDGDAYRFKSSAAPGGGYLRQFFLASESAGHWTRLLELQSYPDGKGMSAEAYANHVGTGLKAKNPYLHYTVLSGQRDGGAVLHYFNTDAAALTGHYVELHVYKFYPDPATHDIIGFHSVERIAIDPKASAADSRKKAQATRERVLAAVGQMQLYRE